MRYSTWPGCWLLVSLLLGCSSSPTSTGPTGNAPGPKDQAEEQVRTAFAALQKAIRERSADQIWALLDEDSRADADRMADEWNDLAKADAPGIAKKLGLEARDLVKLDKLKGRIYLKSKHFCGKYDELADSKTKVDKVTVKGSEATVNYTEPDNDKETLTLIYVNGQWRVRLRMPRM
jgi:hypothetical protein